MSNVLIPWGIRHLSTSRLIINGAPYGNEAIFFGTASSYKFWNPIRDVKPLQNQNAWCGAVRVNAKQTPVID